MAERSADPAFLIAVATRYSPSYAWAANWSGSAPYALRNAATNALLFGAVLSMNHALPTISPSAADFAFLSTVGLLNPLPPTMGWVMPISRACWRTGMASPTRQLIT